MIPAQSVSGQCNSKNKAKSANPDFSVNPDGTTLRASNTESTRTFHRADCAPLK
jgi:hypothetical protein